MTLRARLPRACALPVVLAASLSLAACANTSERQQDTAKGAGVGAGDMFIAIPREHFRYIIELIENFRIDPAKMRELIMPSHAPQGDGADGVTT